MSGNVETGSDVLWADLHSHHAVGYGRGSLERAIDIARSHLDVFAVTPHAAWPDMPRIEGDRHEKWLAGFATVKANWARVQRLVAEANRPGRFPPVTSRNGNPRFGRGQVSARPSMRAAASRPGRFVAILGYEWHSSRFGDWCLLYPGDEGDLFLPDDLQALQAHARATGALLIPHHLGYAAGHRGADFARLAPDVTPVVEVYSEHGGCERDRGPFPMYRHSMGGRSTTNTLQWLFGSGGRAGVVAGTDDHLGYPGAYGEGLTAILAAEPTREAVFAALRARRTYAVTGDRIRLAFLINGRPMGSELVAEGRRRIEVAVEAPDELDRVEVLRNNRVIHRWFPDDAPATPADLDRPVRCRVEFGWGPWSDLALGRVADWRLTARVALSAPGRQCPSRHSEFSSLGGHLPVGGQKSRLIDIQPCFQSGPFDEERRDRIIERSESHCRWVAYTSRQQAFDGVPTKSVILTLAGTAETVLHLDVQGPAPATVSATLGDLLVRNVIHFTGPFPAESLMIHRLVPERMSRAVFAFDDEHAHGSRRDAPAGPDWYYVRVTESNGQAAWSSPIWVGSARR